MAEAVHRVSIAGMRPLALTQKQIIAVLGSAKLVDRMLWAPRQTDFRSALSCGTATGRASRQKLGAGSFELTVWHEPGWLSRQLCQLPHKIAQPSLSILS